MLRPSDLGIETPNFKEFRVTQLEAFDLYDNTRERFLSMAPPTGSGKSGIAVGLARREILRGGMAVILTGTKGLQDQYQTDWGIRHEDKIQASLFGVPLYDPRKPPILWDLRGRANYVCGDYPDKSCAEGQHLQCCRDHDCTYRGNLREANMASNGMRRIPTLNYAYWLEIHRKNKFGDQPWHKPTLLILDEAHLAPEMLSNFLQLKFYESEFKVLTKVPPPTSVLPDDWKQYAAITRSECERTIKFLKSHATANSVDMLIRAQETFDKMRLLATIGVNWIVENKVGPRGGVIWEFSPVWVGGYAERYLFCGASRVVLLSGTIRQRTPAQLGIDRMSGVFHEWPRVFPAYRSPVYHLNTVALNRDSTDGDLWRIVHTIDDLIESRADRKFIIHTGSYKRQEFILKNSKYAEFFLSNTQDPNSESAQEVVARFKQADPPCGLVTPSCGTGWDFPYQECEWQVIVKVPYPDISSAVMQRRMQTDPLYLSYVASQELLQMCGRGMRAEDDRCETFILDNNVQRLIWTVAPRNKPKSWLVPHWFKIWPIGSIPAPPISLYKEFKGGMRDG